MYIFIYYIILYYNPQTLFCAFKNPLQGYTVKMAKQISIIVSRRVVCR